MIKGSAIKKRKINHKILYGVKKDINKKEKFQSMLFILISLAIIILLIIITPVGQEIISEYQEAKMIEGPVFLAHFSEEYFVVGKEITLIIDAKNYDDLAGFEFSLGINPEVLRFEKLTYGNFFDNKFCVPQKNKNSLITNIACMELPTNGNSLTGVSGEGNVVNLSFLIIGRGDSQIVINDLQTLNSQMESIASRALVPRLIIK